MALEGSLTRVDSYVILNIQQFVEGLAAHVTGVNHIWTIGRPWHRAYCVKQLCITWLDQRR